MSGLIHSNEKYMLTADSPYRLFNEGNMFFECGAINPWDPGAEVPTYTGWKDEQMSWKTDCYIGDWTNCLEEMYVSGPDALKFLTDFVTNTMVPEKFEVGRAKHYVTCTPDGKVAGEGILFRLAEDEFMIQCSAQYMYYLFETHKDQYNATARIAKQTMHGNVQMEAELFKIQVSGPKALYLVEKVTGQSMRCLKFMHFTKITVNGRELYALRSGMAGEIGFELQGKMEYFDEIYQYLFEQGREFNCRRLGSRDGMINHLEACFPTQTVHFLTSHLYDEDFLKYNDEQGWQIFYPTVQGSFDGDIRELSLNPYEMGWTSSVKFDHEFRAREALEKLSQANNRTVVTLEYDAEDVVDLTASQFKKDETPYDCFDMPMTQFIVLQANKVLDADGKFIGISTTPGYSYYFRRVISLTFIDPAYAEPGTRVQVIWGEPDHPQKVINATVQPAPYKKDNRRTDLKKA